MNAPTLSSVTGRPLAARTLAGYAADWSLFTDWCAATGHRALPTDAATISAFTTACPAAPGTQRVRVAAIEHHHRDAGIDVPWKPSGATALARPARSVRARELLDPELVATALRLLPSRGWTAGLFGRRDRALLTVAAYTDLPYRELAAMTVGQLDIVDGAAGITDTTGEIHLIEGTTDPVLCGPCALVRWRRIVDIEVGGTSTKGLAGKLKNAKTVDATSRHVCRAPAPIRAKTDPAALFPTINQWGHLPAPIYPLSRHAVSILARQIHTGLPAHRELNVDDVLEVLNPAQPETAVPPVPQPAWDWVAANQKRRAAIADLASLSTVMDDIDARIDELAERTRNLELDW